MSPTFQVGKRFPELTRSWLRGVHGQRSGLGHGELEVHVRGDTALEKLHEAATELRGMDVRRLLGAVGVPVPDRLDHLRVVPRNIAHAIRLEHFILEMNMARH